MFISTCHSLDFFMKIMFTTLNFYKIHLQEYYETDMTQVPSEMALLSSQRHAFQYVSRILSNMEPFSNEEIDVDIDETDGNNKIFSFF